MDRSDRSRSFPPDREGRPTRNHSHGSTDGRRRGGNFALGDEGEARAARLLEAKGYRIAGRNVRAGGVEIDLIARRSRLVVFVEVKTRRSRRFGPPEIAVDAAKRARLIRGAAAWLAEHPTGAAVVRFDVIGLLLEEHTEGNSPTWHAHHIEGAFEAD